MALLTYKLKVVCFTTYFSFIGFFFCMLINCKQMNVLFFLLNNAKNHVFYLQFNSNYLDKNPENRLFRSGHFHFIKTDPF